MRSASEWAPRASRLCDGAGDLAVVLLATWTVVYHVCLVARLHAGTALAIELAVLAVAAACWWALGRRGRGTDRAASAAPAADEVFVDEAVAERVSARGRPERLTWLSGGLVLLAALAFAVKLPWPLTAALWLAASAAGLVFALRRLRTREVPSRAASRVPTPTTAEALVALGWAVALAVVSLVTLRPNPDDLYYVNMSQWVVDHGSFPLRDTIFSDQVFPMSSWPPMASYDGLVGALARLVGVQAGTIAYVVIPPIATVLAVLALWRLLRAWQVRPVWLALSFGLFFLLCDGGPGYATAGNLYMTRLWQGKVILDAFLVPTLLVLALRYVERPSRGRAAWLALGGVAGVGLTTSAMFVVPLVGLVGVAPLAARDKGKALAGFLAVSAYPLAAGVATVALHGHSADDFAARRLYRFDPAWFGHQIFLSGVLAFVAVTAVMLGPFLIPHRAARLTTALAALCVGVTFLPGFTRLTYDLVGLGPTLWRVSWVLPVAALVGTMAVALATAPALPRWATRAGPVALVILVFVTGPSTLTGTSAVSLKLPTQWQRPADSLMAANRIVRDGRTGDVVLAPRDLAISLDVRTTRIKTVAPRDYFMAYLRGAPGFHYAARLRLYDYANSVPPALPPARRLLADLRRVGVDQVCLNRDQRRAREILLHVGYTAKRVSPTYVCLAPS